MLRYCFACVVLMLTITTSETRSADWAPKQAALMTRWAKDVSPENVHREYPRPQMVRKDWSNLNGLWQYAIRPKGDTSPPDKWQGEILVPFPVESALSGAMRRVGSDNRLWYRRQFKISKMGNDGRLLLHFGAVDWQCEVWVNGKSVGKHTGGYDPFSFDITDALIPYKPTDVVDPAGGQEIVVAVWDPTDAHWQPRGKQVNKPHGIWYTPVTGIWQTVWLEPVPASYIRGVTITPDLDNARFTIRADVVNPQPGWKIGFFINSQSKSGGVFHRGWHTDLSKPIVAAMREQQPRLAAHVWSPDNPHLIDVYVALVPDPNANLMGFAQEWMPKLTGPGAPDKAKPVEMADWVRCYTALRKISLGKDDDGVTRLLLNNKPQFQYGPLDQGWWPDGLYTAPTDEALRYDIEITKQLGFNMIRKHVKVEPSRWYYWCDKLGMLVWQDMPNGDRHAKWNPHGGHDGEETTRSQESTDNFNAELKSMIDALRNHPSIVAWVPFNEAWGQFDTVRVSNWIEKYDPTRLVNCASGGNDFPVGHIYDIHRYPGPAAPKPDGKRAIALGEYGGLGLPLEKHTWLDKGNWGYRSFPTRDALTEAYLNLLTQLRPMIQSPGLAAAIYTQTTDVEVEVNGLMTYDRSVIKMPLETIAAANQKLYLPPPQLKTLAATAESNPVKWRYTTKKPADNWFQPDFDTSSWKAGQAGFGQRDTPGAVVRTEWTTPDIWLVREFELSADDHKRANAELHLRMHHDEDAEVYLNGVLVKRVTGYTTGYGLFPLPGDARRALRSGKNAIAIHCHQTGGGQYIDAGIVDVIEQSLTKPR